MKRFFLLAGALVAITLGACQARHMVLEDNTRTYLIGMPKSKILSCIGTPDEVYTVKSREYLIYRKVKTEEHGKESIQRSCTATFTIRDNSIYDVTYTSVPLDTRETRLCSSIVKACM